MTRSLQALKFGSPGRTRTNDQEINSLLLYQLSYRGIEGREFGLRSLNRQAFCAKISFKIIVPNVINAL